MPKTASKSAKSAAKLPRTKETKPAPAKSRPPKTAPHVEGRSRKKAALPVEALNQSPDTTGTIQTGSARPEVATVAMLDAMSTPAGGETSRPSPEARPADSVGTENAPPLATAGTSPEDDERESRMPAVGTVLIKKDRTGATRCEAVVENEGVRYAGKVYKSLSAAALAASADLGLRTRSCNGYLFWGLSKPTRASASEPLRGLERAFERYARVAEVFLTKARAGEHKEPVLTALDRHARVLKNLHDEVA